MSDIAKVTLPNGNTYMFKDAVARQQIADLADIHTSAIHYRGITSTNLVDGSLVNPIIIDNKNFTAKSGDIVIVGINGANQNAPKEFIFNGSKWNEFGSTGALKQLAFKDSVTASYKPSGKVTGTFSGTTQRIESNYTPSGYLDPIQFQGIESTITVTGSLSNAEVNITYTPEGQITSPSFRGTTETLTVGPESGEVTYTPAGTVSTPTIYPTINSGKTNSLKSVGTLPTFSMMVDDDQILNFSFNAGTLPTYEEKTFISSIPTITASQPTFSGTGVRLETTYTPRGTIPPVTFEGTETLLKATVSAPTQTMTGKYTPSGNIPTPPFHGYAGIATANYVPSGDIEGLKFEGTAVTITSS